MRLSLIPADATLLAGICTTFCAVRMRDRGASAKSPTGNCQRRARDKLHASGPNQARVVRFMCRFAGVQW